MLDRLMSGKPFAGGQSSIQVPPLRVVPRRSSEILAISDPALVKAVGFIRDHAHEPIQVPDVARHAGLSRRVLERRFEAP